MPLGSLFAKDLLTCIATPRLPVINPFSSIKSMQEKGGVSFLRGSRSRVLRYRETSYITGWSSNLTFLVGEEGVEVEHEFVGT